MKRLFPILLVLAALATACGEGGYSEAPAALPDALPQPQQESGEAAPEEPIPQDEEEGAVFDGLDLESLDLLGNITVIQENAFTFIPILTEEHDGFDFGMVTFDHQPAETVYYTPATEWGWVLYDVANNTTRLSPAGPEDMQTGMSAYIWGSEQEDGFVADRVMLLKAT